MEDLFGQEISFMFNGSCGRASEYLLTWSDASFQQNIRADEMFSSFSLHIKPPTDQSADPSTFTAGRNRTYVPPVRFILQYKKLPLKLEHISDSLYSFICIFIACIKIFYQNKRRFWKYGFSFLPLASLSCSNVSINDCFQQKLIFFFLGPDSWKRDEKKSNVTIWD